MTSQADAMRRAAHDVVCVEPGTYVAHRVAPVAGTVRLGAAPCGYSAESLLAVPGLGWDEVDATHRCPRCDRN